MSALAWGGLAALLVVFGVVALSWCRAGFLPWRQVGLWLYQVTCWVAGHRWNERELDLMHALPGFRNPYLWVCGRCGAAAMRETEDNAAPRA